MKISKPEHIAQGNGITYMTSDLSLVQLKVLMTIIRELQKPISMMITDIGFCSSRIIVIRTFSWTSDRSLVI